MDINSAIQTICVAAIPLIFAITLHEAAHAWIASKLGDQTASIQGPVSLNPIKHIDPIGTVVLPLIMLAIGGFIFGWAKPVPIAWQNLRNPRRDMALVAIAGPGANLVMAFFWAIVGKINQLIFLHPGIEHTMHPIGAFIHYAALFGIMINCVLLVINLIPLPPLDGSRIVTALLPPALARKYNRLEMYGIWIFLGLLIVMVYTGAIVVITAPIQWLMQTIQHLFLLPTS